MVSSEKIEEELTYILHMAVVELKLYLETFIEQLTQMRWDELKFTQDIEDKDKAETCRKRMFKRASFQYPTALFGRSTLDLVKLIQIDPSCVDDLLDSYDAALMYIQLQSQNPFSDKKEIWEYRQNADIEAKWIKEIVRMFKYTTNNCSPGRRRGVRIS
tara:strand:+ start:274 stop:750 length:477 start_codon:yes stop_codon:yes gene_type:complete